ncbi:hypothetical protein GCM10008106_18330 [Mongoliitalea lutea]|uniref:Uncharacterized protein n=1 Tax=Mongoliitalea lutea TaxID=849756 RepID=A0A8J3G5A2_9BACT|nr:hypothetical protein GCM10008106_18330 [Mongoliitalea lutea]
MFNQKTKFVMKELNFEKLECVNGGCSIEDMMLYASLSVYYAGKSSLLSGLYLHKLYNCM